MDIEFSYAEPDKKMADSLVKGDKLICVRPEGLYDKVGYVTTFANWHKPEEHHYAPHVWWQCQELLDADPMYAEHNQSIWNYEKFDPEIHKDFVIVTPDLLNQIRRDFMKKYGA